MLTLEEVTNVASAPASEVISQTVEAIFEILAASRDVLVKKDTFKELATYLERMVPILRELSKNTVLNSESLNNVLDILNREIRAAKKLTIECSKRNKMYLLMHCRTIVNHLQNTMTEISRALALLPLTSLDLSSGIVEEIGKVRENMLGAEFRAAIAEEEIMEKIESGIQERNMDRSYANSLLLLIAEAVGIPTERSALKKELEEFRSEIENARLKKDQAEAIQMEQIIALLERADAASSPEEKERKYFTKRRSLGSQPLEPLQSFHCPITGDVMVDPVETSSGQTFERTAIEKWLAEGNSLCPLTRTPIDTSVLRPNKTLRQSIEEWKDRNTMITIASMKSKLNSEDEEEVLHCLKELLDLCKQSDLHQEWVILEDYIPILLQLLGLRKPEIRNQVLVNLLTLVKDSDDAKERMARVVDGIELIVRSLGRRVEERKLAVALLLELSKYDSIREKVGMVQGCILLLVTMSNSDDNQAARDARDLLENLSFSDQNVIQMAKANYFEHLLQRLSTGPEDVKVVMASTLADMELTDHNKESLLEGGVLGPLLDMVSHGDVPIKVGAVRALRNLSSLPKNGSQMIRAGAERPLLDLLYDHSSSLSSLREHSAATIMHLARSVVFQESSQTPACFLESEEDIFRLVYMINLTGPDVQHNIILTFHTLCQSPSAISIKTKLIESSAVQVLTQLFEHDNPNLRANAVKLFSCLIEGHSEAIKIREHVGQKCIETIVKIITSSGDDEEIASAMGVISNLPEIPQITEWFVDAGALPIIVSFIQNSQRNGPYKNQVIENAVGAIYRFTVPSNLEWQRSAVEAGIIPLFVQLLVSGTSLTKTRAALSLSRFSQSSPRLSRSLPKRRGLWCFSPPPETGCPVHGGICGIVSSFCLVQAEAVRPLVRMLGEPDTEACEASLDALVTLIEGERLQNGCKVLTDADAIPPIIKFLVQPSPSLQEKALHALERMFRLPEFKQKFGQLAQMPLVDLTQRGTGGMKSMAARILAHLNVLHDQSSYF
ncbi:U-box domain-containing protein 24-like [Argentina anserina]|uniref:U-box domain-containing protein 24-like n=1 Tax=Argentina anserina TaxID=57926 RepID=UPI0021762B63|nr:U-box domain-containing protein 24-like [Potentilla anserina]